MPKLKNKEGYALTLHVALAEIKIDKLERACEELNSRIVEYQKIKADILNVIKKNKNKYEENEKEFEKKLVTIKNLSQTLKKWY